MTALAHPPTDTTALWHELATLVATSPGSADNLLHAHRPDANGLCVACAQGGTGLPVTPWPCSLHKLAVDAAHLHDDDSTPPPLAPQVRVSRPSRRRTCR